MRVLPLLLAASLLVPAGPSQAASAADLAALLSSQIGRCWNPPPQAVGAVTLHFDLAEDGRVIGTPRVNGLASAGFAQDAVHAVVFCQPYHLPPERFSDWQHAVVKLSTGGK